VFGPIKYSEYRGEVQLTMQKGCKIWRMHSPPQGILYAQPRYVLVPSVPEKPDYARVHLLFYVDSSEAATNAEANSSARRTARVTTERGMAIDLTIWDKHALQDDLWVRGSQIELLYGVVNRQRQLVEVKVDSLVRKIKNIPADALPRSLTMCSWEAYSRPVRASQ
jgi:hypothetical protein